MKSETNFSKTIKEKQMEQMYAKLIKNTHKQYLKTKGEYPFVNFHVVVVCEDEEILHNDINEYTEDKIVYLFMEGFNIKSFKVEVKTKMKNEDIHAMNFVVTIEYYN
jgi:hypothetical protein